jgi:cellulose synthase/poly-beta-1,6-N-acetylglucosamine synthase-like glycosyltransferase
VSLSWPALAGVREYHSSELEAIARNAGLHVRRSDYVVAERAFLEMEPLNAFDYARRKLRGFAMHSLPTFRDVLLLELGTRIGAGVPLRTRLDEPFVSVIVSAHNGGDMLRDTLRALLNQTYRNDLYEVVVLHDGSRQDVHSIVAEAAAQGICQVRALDLPHADGPEARNLAMAESRSDISAHTDDACYLPDDWIQAAVSWFDHDTVAVTGPVFLKGGSEGRHLSVPGTRPDPDEKGVCPQHVFPISNTFYRTPIVMAAGGFDKQFSKDGDGPAFGWDTELALRLQRSGWKSRFREEVYQFRLFAGDNARLNWIGREMRRASELPALIAAAPEYGERTLAAGAFASKQTMYFDWALAGFALAATRRQWPWLLTSVPWLALISHHADVWPPTRWPSSARSIVKLTGRQLVWLGGFVRGSIKAKRVVL